MSPIITNGQGMLRNIKHRFGAYGNLRRICHYKVSMKQCDPRIEAIACGLYYPHNTSLITALHPMICHESLAISTHPIPKN